LSHWEEWQRAVFLDEIIIKEKEWIILRNFSCFCYVWNKKISLFFTAGDCFYDFYNFAHDDKFLF